MQGDARFQLDVCENKDALFLVQGLSAEPWRGGGRGKGCPYTAVLKPIYKFTILTVIFIEGIVLKTQTKT